MINKYAEDPDDQPFMLLGSSQGIEAAPSHEGEHVQHTVFRTTLVADCGRYIVHEYKQK